MSVPSACRAVVVGGGVIGSSVAYHLARLGWKDVVVLEQGKVTSGTTWHAAGLVGTMRSTRSETALSLYGTDLYGRLFAETEFDPGFKPCGSCNVARTADRMEALHRAAGVARSLGVAVEMLSADQVADKFTHPDSGEIAMDVSELHGGIWLPGDGSIGPTDVTNALIAGAKQRGVGVFEGVRVTDIVRKDGRATGVETERHGTIEADHVVICAGQWSRQLGHLVGVNIPLHSAEHFYITSQTMRGVWHNMPVVRDADLLLYAREWGNGLLLGCFEEQCKPAFATESGDGTGIRRWGFCCFFVNEYWRLTDYLSLPFHHSTVPTLTRFVVFLSTNIGG
jgi:glycine/D-amino acid oxidase-like deaminating enzyme